MKTQLNPCRLALCAIILLSFAQCVSEEHIDRITLDPPRLDIAAGDSKTLQVHFEAGSGGEVEWFSSNEAVATVSGGTVTAVNDGTATITARTKKGGLLATCDVVVRDRSTIVTGVGLSQSKLDLYMGDDVLLTATVLPETATNKAVLWQSSDIGVVAVIGGLLLPVSEGEAVVTVTTKEGSFTASCEITVHPPFVHVTTLTIPMEFTVAVGESAQIPFVVEPDDATKPEVSWSSFDETICTVSQDGVLTGIAPGSCNVKASVENDSMRKYCLVTVKEPS